MKSYRNKWIEFCPKFGFRIEYDVAGYFDTRPMISFCIGWGAFYIHLPFDTGINECEPDSYGFYWFESALWIKCGQKVHVVYSPWSWDWYRTSYLQKNGEWVSEYKGKRIGLEHWNEPLKSLLWSEKHNYTYTLKNGTIQHRIATLRMSEREWRRRFFMWTSIFNKVVRSLDVDFDGEVGEETGSWKGGTVGCSTEIKEGEDPLTVLRKMELTRKF